ncbi:MAG: c-type cytochrome [Oligoflexales bacterium]
MKNFFKLFLLLFIGGAAVAQSFDFGQPVTESIEKNWDLPIGPQGQNLPKGQGRGSEGKQVYATYCAMCHGQNLEGGVVFQAPALVGGRGSLTTRKPQKTVESYWPYATTLFDYIRRAMPMTSPGVLNSNQTYAVVAYILSESHIIDDDVVMNQDSLPKIVMPNRDGFVDQWLLFTK